MDSGGVLAVLFIVGVFATIAIPILISKSGSRQEVAYRRGLIDGREGRTATTWAEVEAHAGHPIPDSVRWVVEVLSAGGLSDPAGQPPAFLTRAEWLGTLASLAAHTAESVRPGTEGEWRRAEDFVKQEVEKKH